VIRTEHLRGVDVVVERGSLKTGELSTIPAKGADLPYVVLDACGTSDRDFIVDALLAAVRFRAFTKRRPRTPAP
jgi:hypothetical protein